MGFGQGLSGLNAASQELDVIGNNIANAGTVGFKASTVAFADVYATSKVGLGVKVGAVNQRFTVGTITNTGNQLDLAVDGSRGMFRVADSSGNVLYTRNGQFFQDANNFIVNAQGHRLTGFGLVGTDAAPVQVPVGNIEPKASAQLETKANLNAKASAIYTQNTYDVQGFVSTTGAAPYVPVSYRMTIDPATGNGTISGWTSAVADPTTVGVGTNYHFANDAAGSGALPAYASVAAGPIPAGNTTTFISAGDVVTNVARPFSPTSPESYTHSLPLTVYDSLGNPHQLTQYFVKRESTGTTSEWDLYYTFDGNQVATTPSPLRMTYNKDGFLTSDSQITVPITNVGGTTSPAQDLNLVFNYGGSTSFSGDFSYNFTQDGYPTGEFSNIEIGQDGAIIAVYTNGERLTKGYVALASFNNLNGLQPRGDNAWVETGASGQPVLGRPGTNGLAFIRGQSVEESNVDMSQELVKMIISQRFYQANAQTIKTQDQVLQTLITLR